MAEGAGFEPAIRFPAYTLSRRAPSTTRPPLRSPHSLPAGPLNHKARRTSARGTHYNVASRQHKRAPVAMYVHMICPVLKADLSGGRSPSLRGPLGFMDHGRASGCGSREIKWRARAGAGGPADAEAARSSSGHARERAHLSHAPRPAAEGTGLGRDRGRIPKPENASSARSLHRRIGGQ